MDIRTLQRLIVDALEDVKAHDIKVFNTSHLTSLFDRVIVAGGTSNRQTKALAANVREKVKAAGGDVISVEGEDTGEWVLVDCSDAVVHIMQPALRQYYNLEEIWGDKPIRVKLAASSGFSGASASESEDDEEGDRTKDSAWRGASTPATTNTTNKTTNKTTTKTKARAKTAAPRAASGAKTGATAKAGGGVKPHAGAKARAKPAARPAARKTPVRGG